MKLRTKIRYAEAEQYNGEHVTGLCSDADCNELKQHVHTMHGGQIVFVEIGDWIFPEPTAGFYYPVKPEAFAKNWESADNEAGLPPETAKALRCLYLEVDPLIVQHVTSIIQADFSALQSQAATQLLPYQEHEQKRVAGKEFHPIG